MVAEPREVEPSTGDVADEPERPRIDLDDLVPAVPGVELELHVEDAPVVDGREEPLDRLNDLADLLEGDGHVGAGVGELRGIHAHPTARDHRGDRPGVIHEAVDEDGVRRAARDPLLEDVRDSAGGRLLDAAARLLAGVDEEALRPEPAVVQVGLGRLEEPVADRVVRRQVEIRRAVDDHGLRPGQIQAIGQQAELVLVDELLDRRGRWQAGRKSLLQVGREAGDRERPLVAAREEHGPRQVEPAQEGREDLRVRGLD